MDLKQWEHKHIINWTLKQWEQKHRFTIDIESNGTLLNNGNIITTSQEPTQNQLNLVKIVGMLIELHHWSSNLFTSQLELHFMKRHVDQ